MYEWQYATATGQMYNQINYQTNERSNLCGVGHARVGGGEQKGVGENAGIGFLNIPSSGII